MQQYPSKKTIVHTLWDFKLGGGPVFAVNLANEQAKHHNVVLINMSPHMSDSSVTSRIDPKVKVIELKVNPFIKRLSYRIGNYLSGMKHNSPLYSDVMAIQLRTLIKGADIVHTHLVRERFIVSKALKFLGKSAPKHIMTDHGGFLQIEKKFQDTGEMVLQFNKKVFDSIVASCDCVVTISDPQNEFWQEKQKEGYRIRYKKIYNGNPSAAKCPKTRAEMGYYERDFIFTVVGRGSLPTKGWEVTINAFLKNNDPSAKLMLVGGGSEIERLKRLHGNNPNIKFTGMVQNPADLIHIADVGILASTYGSESLPNSIIEYLAAGKPAIGSNIGEIKNMLQIGKEEVGILLPIEKNKIDVELLAAAMNKMQYDKAAYEYFKMNTAKASQQYDISHCANRYATEAYGFTVQ